MAKRVLIVEDFEDNRNLLRTILEMHGFEVLEADNGYNAVAKAVREHPDIILMDIAMPVMDGIQATQAIREHDHLNDVPIVAITAYRDFYAERAKDVGCNGVIQKPLDVARVGSVVEQYIH